MGLAHYTSTRSSDSETKVGCVIVGDDNRVLSMGYNGFPMGIDDSNLPTTRPNKYPYIVHAEENAISNMLLKPSTPMRAYITHVPCGRCSKLMWQNNIRHWLIPKDGIVKSHSKDDEIVYNLLKENGLRVELVTPDFSHIIDRFI